MPESKMNDEATMMPDDLDADSPLPQEQPEEPEMVPMHPVELTEEAAELLRLIETERDEAVESRQRALADFVNFQRRAAENEQQSWGRGQINVIKSLLPVLDDFNLALNQPEEQITVEQLLGGLRIARDSLQQAIESHGVTCIDPQIGDEFDPNRHEAMLKQPSAEVAPNHIVMVLQTGYAIGELVLRPAKVALAEPDASASSPSSSCGPGGTLDLTEFDDLVDLE